MKNRLAFASCLFLRVFAFSAPLVFAADAGAAPAGDSPASLISGGLNAAAEGTGYSTSLSLPSLIGKMISIGLGVVGIVLVIMIVYAGILYMTAGGEDAKIKTAKKMITQSVIGIILMVSAYAIANFIISRLSTVAG